MYDKEMLPQLSDHSDDRLQRELAELAARRAEIEVAMAERLVELDRRTVWKADGCRSMANWVAVVLHTSPRTSRQTMRVAQALHQLPQVAKSYMAGELSCDEVNEITRVASPVL